MKISIVDVLDIVLATTTGKAWGEEEGATGATTEVLWQGTTPRAPLFHVKAPCAVAKLPFKEIFTICCSKLEFTFFGTVCMS